MLPLFSLIFLLPVSADAKDLTSTFSVTVPTALALYADENGDVITPSNFCIENIGENPIGVGSIKISPENGYELMDYSVDVGRKPVSSRCFSLKFDGYAVSSSGDADLSGIPFLSSGDRHTIDVKALCSMPGRSVNDEVIGSVLFIVSWQSGKLYSISFTKMPDKTVYLEGENFSAAGMEIRALYFGGESEIIDTYSIPDGTDLKAGTSYVTVLASKDGYEKSCQIPIRVEHVLTSIEISSPPSVTSYTSGDRFSPSGMIVTAVYSDGTKKVVTDYNVYPSVLSSSNRAVTVTYEENGVKKSAILTVEVKKVLSSLKIETAPRKTSYVHGDTFSPDGAGVTAVFTDGTSADVTSSVTWSPKEIRYGMSEITASYSYGGITKSAVQKIQVIRQIKSVEISSMPLKTSYIDGEQVDLTGMKIRVVYTDGGSEESSSYTYSPSAASLGDTKINITSNGRVLSVPITVRAKEIKSTPTPAPSQTPEIKSLSDSRCSISLEKTSYTYSKSACTPSVNVSYSGKALNSGTDYDITYSDNINAGTASVKLVGRGDYSGERILNFSIVPKSLSVSWSGGPYYAVNELQQPVPTLNGVISGDSCEAVLEGKGNIAPGSYTCRISSLTNANYCLSESSSSCSYTIESTGTPLLSSGPISDKLQYAGFSKAGGEYRIRNVIFTPCYIPDGSETYSMKLDALSEGYIKGYIVPACSYGGYSYSDLIISGNGSDHIYANPDSTGAFSGICHYLGDSLGGGFTNLNMLDTTYAVTLSYMFSGLTLKSLDISHFYIPDAMTLDHMFYMSNIGSINFGSMDTWHVVNMSYMFACCGGMETLDLSNFNTSHLRYLGSMFASHRTTKVIDLSSFDTSYVTDFSYMFSGLKDAEVLNISSFTTSDADSLAGMFEDMDIAVKELDLSSWDTSNVTDMRSMFEDTCLESVYLNFSTSKVRHYDSMFGGTNSKLQNIFENNSYSVKEVTTSYMFPFTGNPNIENSDDLDIFSLRPDSAGGVFKTNPRT